MKMYCYTYYAHKIVKEGYLSAAANPDPKQLAVYAKRAGSDDYEEIKKYLDNTFPGRSRSVCCLTEYAPAEEYAHPYLNYLVHHASVISFDLKRLIQDNLVEAIYCKDCSETFQKDPSFENIRKIENLTQIDTSPLDWHLSDGAAASPYSTLRHYIIVLTKGFIPPEYITIEIQGEDNPI